MSFENVVKGCSNKFLKSILKDKTEACQAIIDDIYYGRSLVKDIKKHKQLFNLYKRITADKSRVGRKEGESFVITLNDFINEYNAVVVSLTPKQKTTETDPEDKPVVKLNNKPKTSTMKKFFKSAVRTATTGTVTTASFVLGTVHFAAICTADLAMATEVAIKKRLEGQLEEDIKRDRINTTYAAQDVILNVPTSTRELLKRAYEQAPTIKDLREMMLKDEEKRESKVTPVTNSLSADGHNKINIQTA